MEEYLELNGGLKNGNIIIFHENNIKQMAFFQTMLLNYINICI